jgi:hypothetical protein
MDDTVKDIFSRKSNFRLWNGLLDLFISNAGIFSKLLTRIYQKIDYKIKSLEFLISYDIITNETSVSNKDHFQKIWNTAREKRKREKDVYYSLINSIEKHNTSGSIVELIKTSLMKQKPIWIDQLDSHRINFFFTDIMNTLGEFNSQESFEDKERYFNICMSQIHKILEEVDDSPTEFSYNILRSKLLYLEKLINAEFLQIVKTSKPILAFSIMGESSINETDNIVRIQIAISNKKGCAPVSQIMIDILNTNDVEFINENNLSNSPVKGGEQAIFKLKIKISEQVKQARAANLDFKCSYRVRGNEEEYVISGQLTLKLYSEIDFNPIVNSFAVVADSGPVMDKNMFYGRDQFINDIMDSIINSNSKCVIVYGQKRSGKSSVLHHLKEKLMENKKAFCISFSLGEIIEELSPLTFYYKILSEIEDSLEKYEINGSNVIDFKSPSLDELKVAPAIIFNEKMNIFKHQLSKGNLHNFRTLVLLIDEFTYIYTAIQRKFLSDQFMKTWKSFLEKGMFSAVLVGQDIMPKFKEAYPNEFGVTEDKRLTYLDASEAKKLIEKPIWDRERNKSRYLGRAIDLILDYTSANPYYVQIFCARLVDFMNQNKAINVTEADIHEVADTFISGEHALVADKFDNLITAGDADLEAIPIDDTKKTLKEIALASKNLDFCPREAINLGDSEYEEKILKDLRQREVLSCPQPGYYKINVRLFKNWLIKN